MQWGSRWHAVVRFRALNECWCIAGVTEPATKLQRTAQPVVENDKTSPVVAEVPSSSGAPPPTPSATVPAVNAGQVEQPSQQFSAVAAAMSAPIAPSAVPERTTKYRHQWLQTPTHVEVRSPAAVLIPLSRVHAATLPAILVRHMPT